MSDKPCRWLLVMDAHPAWGWRKFNACIHPLIVHMGEDKWYNGRPAKCEGCPCHEPEPDESGVKESLTAQPDHIGDTNKMLCKWWQDEYGNWCCSCRSALPQFTPWRGTSPTGHNCPYCRGIIGMDPPYSESIHPCGPHCERPACVKARTESGEFPRVHDKP